MSGNQPIAVFDSGVGGLGILNALEKHFPQETFIYLGDTARLPYGSKSPQVIAKYVEQNLNFLARRQPKVVVVACNSASAVIRERHIESKIPLFEVITPTATVAARRSQNGRIGVMGTHATINQGAYPHALAEISRDLKVFSQAAPLLVPLVEENWLEDPLTNLIIHRYISPLLGQGIDTLILGCTHFPFLGMAIRKVVGPHIELVDAHQAMIDRLEQTFEKNEISRARARTQSTAIFATDLTPRFESFLQQIVSKDHKVELVDLQTS